MSLRSFLAKIKRQEPNLSNLKVVGGPVDITERIYVRFMPDQSTTPRNIELRSSEDSRVYAVIWHVDKEAHSKIFKNEPEAHKFYDEIRTELHENARAEAALIKTQLQQQYNESWKDAKNVYFHKGFRVRIGFSETEELAKINPQFLGLIRGPCPYCKVVEDFDARENFQRFLENLDSILESSEGVMPSHGGLFSEVGLPVRSSCPNCLSYPNVFFTAQANKGLLKKLRQRGGGEET